MKQILVLFLFAFTLFAEDTLDYTIDTVQVRPAPKSGKTIVKKRGYVGFTFGFSHSEGENYKALGLVPITNNDQTSVSVDLLGGYMLKKFFSVGGGLNYEYDRSEGQYTDTTTSRSVSSTYSVVPHIRNYLPWTQNLFFQIYNQTNLGFGYGTGVQESDDGTSIDRATTSEFTFHLGIQPGMSFFIAKGVTVETSVNLLGVTLSRQKIEYSDDSTGFLNKVDGDFKIDLISIRLGITIYI